MRYRLLDLAFSRKLGRIDDEPLQRLLHGHRVLSVQEHFYIRDEVPHVLVGVRYALGEMLAVAPAAPPRQGAPETQGPDGEAAATGPRTSRRRRSDWREILREQDQEFFETLRAWRSARARADAVPPYVVLTNAQLAEVARHRPTSLAALRAIDGLGEKRVAAFGRQLLSVIETGVVPPSPAEAVPGADR